MNILEQLAAHARKRTADDKARISPEEMKELAIECGRGGGSGQGGGGSRR